MKKQPMRKCLAALTIALAVVAVAQQPQQCVNPIMLDGLVFLGRPELAISVTRGQAAFMKDVKLPAQLVLIGAGVRQPGMTTVAYKTSLASEKAYAAMLAPLEKEGWTVQPEMGAAATFNVSGGARQGMLCRDGEMRYLMVKDAGSVRYVNVVSTAGPRQRDCNADPSLSWTMPTMPRFRFPEGASMAVGGGGGGGSNTNYMNSSRIITADTPPRLLEYLAPQLEALGWEQDATWSGAGSAGSSWRGVQDGQPARGTLAVIRVSEGAYDVHFNLTLPN